MLSLEEKIFGGHLTIGILVVLGGAVGILLLFFELSSRSARERVMRRMTENGKDYTGRLFRFSRLATILLGIGAVCIGGKKGRLKATRLLTAAGFFDVSAVSALGLLQASVALLAMVAVSRTAYLGGHSEMTNLSIIVGVGLCGLYLPSLGLKMLARRRVQTLRRELPIVITMMLMTTESGSNIDQAIRFAAAASDRGKLTIRKYLGPFIAEVDQGVAYEDALGRLGQRLSFSEASDLATLLNQSVYFGTAITGSLRALLDDLLEQRLTFAREKIGRQAAMISVIVIACFLPAVFIVFGGPAAISVSHSIKNRGNQ